MSNILVLDDVQDAVGLMRKVLTRQGHSVVTFTEEQEAIDHVENNEVELAILDIKLKKMNGIQVLEEMKKRRPQLKAIMLTGYPTLETARTAMELGAGEYCVKPIDITELKEKVADVLRQ